MPKIKTRKTAAKRFKQTGTGKFLHGHAHHNHLNIHKSRVQYAEIDVTGRALPRQEEGRPSHAAERSAQVTLAPRPPKERLRLWPVSSVA